MAEDVDSPVSFSPDGSQFVFKRDDPSRHESSLITRSVESGHEATLAQLKYPDAFYNGPLWSPEGTSILCGTYEAASEARPRIKIVSIRLRDKAVQRLNMELWDGMKKPIWIRNGDGIAVAARSIYSNRYQLAAVSWPKGTVTPVSHDTEDYRDLDAAADATKIVGVSTHLESSLWVAALRAPEQPRLIASGKYYGVTWTKSGDVLSQSDTGGQPDLWSIDTKTGKTRAITNDPYMKRDPVTTPEDRYLVYSSNRSGSTHLWRSGLDGSDSVQLTSGASFDYQPTVTPDGHWVIYTSNRAGYWALWKVSIDGGEPTQTASEMAKQSEVSPDGRLIACNYSKFPFQGWTAVVLRYEDGRVVRSYPAVSSEASLHWSVDGKNLFFVVTADGVSNVWIQPVDGRPPRQLTHFTQETIFAVSPSPDGRSLAFTRGRETSNLVLLDPGVNTDRGFFTRSSQK